jgi:hypothetical protein
MATLESKVCIPEDVLFRDVGDEAVILSLETGKYYGLDGVGVRMWSLLAQHGQVEPAYRTLLDEYEVSEEQLLKDLLRLVDELASQGLVQVDEA